MWCMQSVFCGEVSRCFGVGNCHPFGWCAEPKIEVNKKKIKLKSLKFKLFFSNFYVAF